MSLSVQAQNVVLYKCTRHLAWSCDLQWWQTTSSSLRSLFQQTVMWFRGAEKLIHGPNGVLWTVIYYLLIEEKQFLLEVLKFCLLHLSFAGVSCEVKYCQLWEMSKRFSWQYQALCLAPSLPHSSLKIQRSILHSNSVMQTEVFIAWGSNSGNHLCWYHQAKIQISGYTRH